MSCDLQSSANLNRERTEKSFQQQQVQNLIESKTEELASVLSSNKALRTEIDSLRKRLTDQSKELSKVLVVKQAMKAENDTLKKKLSTSESEYQEVKLQCIVGTSVSNPSTQVTMQEGKMGCLDNRLDTHMVSIATCSHLPHRFNILHSL